MLNLCFLGVSAVIIRLPKGYQQSCLAHGWRKGYNDSRYRRLNGGDSVRRAVHCRAIFLGFGPG
jgi:hypothetical protein